MIPEAAVEAALEMFWAKEDEPYIVAMRLALEAAAPRMVRDAKADAWDEGIEAGVDVRTRKLDYARNPYRTTK